VNLNNPDGMVSLPASDRPQPRSTEMPHNSCRRPWPRTTKANSTSTRQTITEIAKGVGYRCSNPECARPTVGANAAQDGIIIIGVAAHICAASPGGAMLIYTTGQSVAFICLLR
jgi:hypothetical protein